jgi:hypothetical protein
MLELTFDAIVTARTCYAAAKLGIADLLANGARTSDELAQEIGVHPRALYRLLRALTMIGLVTEAPGQRFSLTELGATLRGDVPGSMRSWVEFCGDPYYLEAWVDILYSIETGRPAFDHAHGRPLFDYLAEHPQESRVFDQAMTSLTSNDAPDIVAAYDFAFFERLIDVGGGQGTLLLEILQTHQRATGVLFDRPHVTGGAAERIAELGLDGRCVVESGDFFTEVPAGGDAYLLKYILHDWDDANCERILSSCRRAIAPSGKLLAIETVVPPPGVSGHSKLDDIEMMVLLGSQERTEEEYTILLERSGFRLTRVVPVNWLLSVIEAEPL